MLSTGAAASVPPAAAWAWLPATAAAWAWLPGSCAWKHGRNTPFDDVASSCEDCALLLHQSIMFLHALILFLPASKIIGCVNLQERFHVRDADDHVFEGVWLWWRCCRGRARAARLL